MSFRKGLFLGGGGRGRGVATTHTHETSGLLVVMTLSPAH